MKIKFRTFNKEGKSYAPKRNHKGDWIDLYAAESTTLMNGQDALIPLGIAMQLPAGFEAIVAPRSSCYIKHGIIMSNSIGIIDCSYNGDTDQWHFPAVALRDTHIGCGTRICQFRIQPSQYATIWQKIKWLFTSKIQLEEVDVLLNESRGGFGSTGDR